MHISHPDVYEQFKNNHMFVIKSNTGSFNAVALDMKLEQTRQRSKKEAGVLLVRQDKVHLFLSGNLFIMRYWP